VIPSPGHLQILHVCMCQSSIRCCYPLHWSPGCHQRAVAGLRFCDQVKSSCLDWSTVLSCLALYAADRELLAARDLTGGCPPQNLVLVFLILSLQIILVPAPACSTLRLHSGGAAFAPNFSGCGTATHSCVLRTVSTFCEQLPSLLD
jgi:hypothetical protein